VKRWVWPSASVLVAVLALAHQATAAALAQPQTTKQLPGVPCSVTAYGLAFAPAGSSSSMSYGGGISCAGGVGQKTLNVVPQVSKLAHGRRLWYDLSLVGLYQGPTPANPLRLTGSTSFVHGHVYRLLVYGRVTMPDGRVVSTTVCSGCAATAGPAPSLSIVGRDYYSPQSPVTVAVKGTSCAVTEIGPEFTVVNGTYVNSYSGITTCGSSAKGDQISLAICAQVVNRVDGKDVWYTISGSSLSATGTAPRGPALYTARTAYLGHGYRIKASTTITSASAGRVTRRTATAYSRGWAP
jgi:hypothetical protein